MASTDVTQVGDRDIPLHYAAVAAHCGAECAAALLAARADVAAKANDRKQAVHIAAENRASTETLAILLQGQADPNARTLADRTPLHFAAIEGVASTTQVLLAAGADVNAMNSCGAIPLHWAAKTGKRDVCELLVAAKSDLTVMDNLGRTPAEMAADNLQTSVRDMLQAMKH